MHGSNESLLESESGPTAFVKSLNGHLLELIANHRPSVDLSTLDDHEFFSKAKKTLKDGLKLLDHLVSLLPAEDGVFVIVDSLSRLSGSREDEDKVMERLEEIMSGRDDINVKVLVTNPLVGPNAKKVVERTLYVLDSVFRDRRHRC